jgi:hypothetical protein
MNRLSRNRLYLAIERYLHQWTAMQNMREDRVTVRSDCMQ